MCTRLTDAVFFGEHLDTTRPGLTEIPALAAKGDYKACRKVFSAYVRGMLQPERHFSKVPAIQKNLADGVDYERAEKAFTRARRLPTISSPTGASPCGNRARGCGMTTPWATG